jgi:hypothetical protein
MNANIEIDAAPKSATEIAPATASPKSSSAFQNIDIWIDRHLSVLAHVVVAAGFAARIYVATRSYLNPDEAMHYMWINQASALQAYRASVGIAHPPLLYLLLYFWHFLGRSELMMRLPSVIAGTATCWLVHKWIGMVFGRAAGLAGLVIAAFSPAMIAVSAEVREYSLLLCCIAAAVYFLELAFREKSVSRMWCFSFFLWMAILTHYSALFFTVAMGLYALTRVADPSSSRKILVAWAAGQAIALAIYSFLYVTQVSKLQNAIGVWGAGFSQSYYRTAGKDIFTFTWENTSRIFLYTYEQPLAALAMLLLFASGVLVLFFQDLVSRKAGARSDHSGILVALPFIAVWGAAIVGKYPYVGSRHTIFLAPFAIAGVSFLLAMICRQKLWAGIFFSVLLMAASNATADSREREITNVNQNREQMTAAIEQMRHSIGSGDRILVDMQSSFPFAYYYCNRRELLTMQPSGPEYRDFSCNGHTIVSVILWKLAPIGFPSQFENVARRYGWKAGDRVWLFQNGWGKTLAGELQQTNPRYRCLGSKNYGENLSVIPFVVGPDLLPDTPESNCGSAAPNSIRQ